MLVELIADLLPWPGGANDADRANAVLRKVMPDRLYVPETDSPGAIKRALNESGWLDGEVLAAGDVRQGTEPTVVGMLTGAALVQIMRARRLKAVPRHFVLAATSDRVVAFKVISSGDDGIDEIYELWIDPREAGSWSRESVRLIDLASTAGTLELDGVGRAAVFRAGKDPSTAELFALLAG